MMFRPDSYAFVFVFWENAICSKFFAGSFWSAVVEFKEIKREN